MRFSALLLLFISHFCFAQNLLPNGGFEQYTSLPTVTGDYAKASGWSNCNGGGSPDYYHINGSGQVKLPNAFSAIVSPHGGSAIMGLSMWYAPAPEFREYVSHALSSPLVVGQSYTVSFFITNGVCNGNFGGAGINQASVAFSTGPWKQITAGSVSTIGQKHIVGSVLYDTAWRQISFTFMADSAYNYIIFGNFVNDASTVRQQFDIATNKGAYYFLDDITLQRDSGCVPGQLGIVTALHDTVCADQPPVMHFSGVAIADIQWQYSIDGTNYSDLVGLTGPDCLDIPNQTSYYRVKGTTGSCPDTTVPIRIVLNPNCQVTDAQTPYPDNEAVSIYPNPSSMNNVELTITNSLLGSKLEVYDDDGRLIQKYEIRSTKSEIELNVAQGIYLLRISSPKATIMRKMIRL